MIKTYLHQSGNKLRIVLNLYSKNERSMTSQLKVHTFSYRWQESLFPLVCLYRGSWVRREMQTLWSSVHEPWTCRMTMCNVNPNRLSYHLLSVNEINNFMSVQFLKPLKENEESKVTSLFHCIFKYKQRGSLNVRTVFVDCKSGCDKWTVIAIQNETKIIPNSACDKVCFHKLPLH